MHKEELKNEIMLRVHTLYWLRKLSEPTSLRILAFGVMFVALISSVSIADVALNALGSFQSPRQVWGFIVSAITGSLLLVKLLLAAELIVGLALVRDIFPRIFSRLQFVRLPFFYTPRS